MLRNRYVNYKPSIIIILLVVSVFTKELFTLPLGNLMIDTFSYSFFTIYFILKLSQLKLSPLIVRFFGVWFFLSSITIVFLGLKYIPFFKQAIPITIIFFSAYDILYRQKSNIKEVFELYVKISFYVSIFGIIQWLFSVLFGINLLIKEPGLLDSITYEPSHYAAVIIPAAVYRYYFYQDNKIEAIAILVSLLLTFSLTSYVVFIIAITIPRIRLISLPVVIILFLGFYKVLPLAHERIAVRVELMEELLFKGADRRPYDIPGMNLSIISITSNLDVAFYSIKNNPILGSGLGGHETMYYRFFKDKPFQTNPWFGINYNSAHSISIRILSEAGLIGFLFYILFLFKRYIKKRNGEFLYFHVISLACISHFLSKSFKLGGYIDYGTPFFFVFLIINYLVYKSYVKSKTA